MLIAKIIFTVIAFLAALLKMVMCRSIDGNLLITIIYLIIIIWSIKYKKTDKKESSVIDIEQSGCIRGLMACLIVLSHAGHYLDDISYMKLFKPFGYIGVSVFFFYSGYGVAVSGLNNPGYLKNYWKKRLCKLYIYRIYWRVLYACSVISL